MKWSICSTGYRDKPLEYVLQRAAEWALDGVEIWTGHIDEYVQRNLSLRPLKQQLRDLALHTPVMDTYLRFQGSVENRMRETIELERTLRLSAELDIPLLRVFAGGVSSSQATLTDWEEVLEGLGHAAASAKQYGIQLALELHNLTLADTLGSTRRILEQLRSTGLKIVFDGFNLFLEHEPVEEAFEQLYGDIAHVHMKNYRWDFSDSRRSLPTPILDGDADNRKTLDSLLQKNYGGFISLEYFGEEGEVNAHASVLALRQSPYTGNSRNESERS